VGLPVSGQVNLTTRLNTYLDYGALFAQDDWRITPRLTLNLGLRWEAETGLNEDHNQLAVGFDRTATASTDNDQTPTNSLSSPFPSGLQKPAGHSAGLLTGMGNSVTLGPLNIAAAERAKWVSVLDDLKLQHTNSQATFVFFHADRPQLGLATQLRGRGIEIGRSFPPLTIRHASL
jgi:hypothetical protein